MNGKLTLLTLAVLIVALQVTSAKDSGERRKTRDSGERRKTTARTTTLITAPANVFDPVNFNASGLGLRTINSAFFVNYDVTKIQNLDLSNNQITALEPNTFVNFTSLTTLNLSNNQINRIAVAWLNNLPLLSTLNLNNNKLSYLPTGVFFGLSLLTSLGLMSNTITIQSIDNLPFIGLISLTSLNLSNNKLVRTFPFTFVSNFKLQTLNLRNAGLVSIDKSTFSNAFAPFNGTCLATTNVLLSGNALPVVPPGACFTVQA